MIRRVLIPGFLSAAVALSAGASLALGQAQLGGPVSQPTTEVAPFSGTAPASLDFSSPSRFSSFDRGAPSTGFLTGNVGFQNFIGFISNPIQSIDPRATTEFWPVFGSSWASGNSAILPSGNMQVYGAGINVALSDRLMIGFNQGGYAVADFSRERARVFAKLGLPVPDRDVGGQREGWLNLGGYVQYTLIADVPDQFILSAGMRWEAPAGATQVFQGGANPAYLAPYLTAGKEFFGCYHLLATTGYEFAAGSGQATTSTFYLNLHLDRKIGWFYPLIELNGSYQTRTVDLNLPIRHDVINLGTFASDANILSLAVGANAVLVPGKLEFGAVYIRPVTSQDRFDFNGMIVKMVWRY